MIRSSILKIFLVLAIISILMVLAGCSDFSKDEKEAFKAVVKYQEEYYPQSNKELEIEYPGLKDIDEDNIIEGKSQYGNDTFKIIGTYTYNPKKVQMLESSGESDER